MRRTHEASFFAYLKSLTDGIGKYPKGHASSSTALRCILPRPSPGKATCGVRTKYAALLRFRECWPEPKVKTHYVINATPCRYAPTGKYFARLVAEAFCKAVQEIINKDFILDVYKNAHKSSTSPPKVRICINLKNVI